MNSQEAKVAVLNFLLYHSGYEAAFTESLNQSDVLGIRESMFTTEIEIKVDRSDLLNELHTIQCVSEPELVAKLRQRRVKYQKHSAYLGNSLQRKIGLFLPNYFYLAFPPELKDRRLNMLEKTKYGIMIIENGVVTIEKKAEKIHDEKIDQSNFLKLMRKACTENLGLREKLLRKEL